MKKLMLLLGLFMASAISWAYDLEVDGIYYNANVQDMTLSVTNGETPYEGNIEIPEYVVFNGRTFTVTEIAGSAFTSSNITTAVIPKSVVTINGSSFASCNKLTSVSLAEGLIRIGDYAFKDCLLLEEITIPSSVTEIGEMAFSGSGLKNIDFQGGNEEKLTLGYYGSGTSPFKDTPLNSVYLARDLYYYNIGAPFANTQIQDFQIGQGVTELPDDCLSGLTIERLVIPSSVKTIGRRCIVADSLKVLIIEDSRNSLFWSVYNSCPNIKMLYLGRNLTVEQYNTAFNESTLIDELDLGVYVTKLDDIYFNSSIKNIYVANTNPISFSISPFTSKTYLYGNLYVPAGSSDTYSSSEGWKNFWNISEAEFPYSNGGSGTDSEYDEGEVAGEISVNGTVVTITNPNIIEGEESVTCVINELGITDHSSAVGTYTLADGSVLAVEQGEGKNQPSYYSSSNGIRFYANNKLVLACKNYIAKIEFECDSYSGTDYIGNSTQTAYFYDHSASYCNLNETDTGGTQLRLQKIIITYGKPKYNGIDAIYNAPNNKIYTISGVPLSSANIENLKHGIYIINGKKIVIK